MNVIDFMMGLALVLGLVVGITTVTGFALQVRRLKQEREAAERHLTTMREYGRKTARMVPTYVDVILFGPRASGKTSIAWLWTNPWARIGEVRPSPTWHTYETNVHEYKRQKYYDEEFKLERPYIRTVRLRLHDYPGEDSYRLQAVKDLEQRIKPLNSAKKTVVIFVLKVGNGNGQLESARENEAYYSRVFVEEVNRHLQSISGAVDKAFVVFNKVDLLGREWDEEAACQKLRQANDLALYQIERLFAGMLEYHTTSARTGQGLIRLLGSVGLVAVNSKEEQENFKQTVQYLEQAYQSQGV